MGRVGSGPDAPTDDHVASQSSPTPEVPAKKRKLLQVMMASKPEPRLTHATFQHETESRKKPDRSEVFRMNLCFNSIEIHIVEAPIQNGRQRLKHETLTSRKGCKLVPNDATLP